MEPIYAVCWKYTDVLSSMHLFRFQYGDWGFCLGLIRLFQDLQHTNKSLASLHFQASSGRKSKQNKQNILKLKILLLWIFKIYFLKNEYCYLLRLVQRSMNCLSVLWAGVPWCSLLSPGGLSVSLCPVASLQSCRDQPPETDLIHIPSSAAEKVSEGGMER